MIIASLFNQSDGNRLAKAMWRMAGHPDLICSDPGRMTVTNVIENRKKWNQSKQHPRDNDIFLTHGVLFSSNSW